MTFNTVGFISPQSQPFCMSSRGWQLNRCWFLFRTEFPYLVPAIPLQDKCPYMNKMFVQKSQLLSKFFFHFVLVCLNFIISHTLYSVSQLRKEWRSSATKMKRKKVLYRNDTDMILAIVWIMKNTCMKLNEANQAYEVALLKNTSFCLFQHQPDMFLHLISNISPSEPSCKRSWQHECTAMSECQHFLLAAATWRCTSDMRHYLTSLPGKVANS